MSSLFPILRFIAIALLVLFLFAQYQKRRSLFWPAKFPEGEWQRRYAVQPEDLEFVTSDGVRLHGWLFRAAAPRAALVWFHGNGGNLTHRADVAAEFARRGVTTFVFDYRGYGKSDGTPTERALYRDSIAAYEALQGRVGHLPISLYGESLGGPYAAYVAARKATKSVVIENSFPSLTAVGNAIYSPVPLGWFVPGSLTTTRSLNRARRPVLVMHGKRDGVIPFKLGIALYDGIKGEKEFFASELAGHSEIASVEGERYFATVTRFVVTHSSR